MFLSCVYLSVSVTAFIQTCPMLRVLGKCYSIQPSKIAAMTFTEKQVSKKLQPKK